MKIAFVYDVLYPYTIGGGDKLIWELAKRFAAKGHVVHMITSKIWEGENEMMVDGVHIKGVCPWKPVPNNLGDRTFLHLIRFTFGVFKHLLTNRFDLVYCSAFPYLPCFAAKFAGFFKPTELIIRWDEARCWKPWIKHAGLLFGTAAAILEIMTSTLVKKHTAVSEYTAQRMIRFLGMQRKYIKVIPCGVDTSLFYPDKSIKKEKTILFVGRLIRHKRASLLVKSFSEVIKDHPDYILKIVGVGSEKDNVISLAKRLGLDENVIFVNEMDEHTLIDEFRRASVFVLPSEQEGFGMVMIESMAAGTPVIASASKLSAASFLITHRRNGLLFKTQNDLTFCLNTLLANPLLNTKLIENGLKTVMLYDWDKSIIPQAEAYFQKVLNG